MSAGMLSAATAADLLAEIRAGGLDPDQCYRVRDLSFAREDLRFSFTDGFLIFGKPVAGRRVSAVFAAPTEGGDAELLVMPPTREERQSLAGFTGSPNLNERFLGAVMLFTDGSGEALEAALRARGDPLKSPEMGALLAESWSSVARNLSESFGVRLIEDLMTGPRPGHGFFYAAIRGRQLGSFDAMYDSEAREHIYLGQLNYRDNRAYFDTWASFPARPFRTGARKPAGPGFTQSNFRIHATLEESLLLKARTQLTVTPDTGPLKVLGFEISPAMKVGEVKVNGEPADVFRRESLRANLIRGGDNETFLVIPPEPLEAGRHYEIEVEHEGSPISQAGQNVYYVGARGNWYPRHGLHFARYDITFAHPARLQLLFPGELKEDRTEGDVRVVRRTTPAPIRLAGFNLGDYEKVSLERASCSVEVYANRRVEEALQNRTREAAILAPPPFPWQGRRAPGGQSNRDVFPPTPLPPPDPTARLRTLAGEVANAYEFLTAQFGPPPLRNLMVSPIPGTFGQGFPGLVYLSTLAYLDAASRPTVLRAQDQQVFFSEMLPVHETAHQWWGNLVTSASYRDDWLMEALANYSALFLLERKKGPKALTDILDAYREHLLSKDDDGRTLESAGPVRWGLRLRSSQTPSAWRAVLYEKGSWIIHMLRRRLGDERFLKMLGEVTRRHGYQTLDTEQFRELAAAALPPGSPDPKLESFFDHWVHGTGIPSLKLSWTVKGKAPNLKLTGTVTQSETGDDVSLLVPVQIQVARARPITQWVQTSADPVSFTMNLKTAPLKVLLDPDDSVLAVKR